MFLYSITLYAVTHLMLYCAISHIGNTNTFGLTLTILVMESNIKVS